MIRKLINENPQALIFSSFNIVQKLSISVAIPFFSLILLGMGWSTTDITYFFAIFAISQFLFSPIIGKLSDQIGKKQLIILGMFMQAFFFYVYYFSTSIPLMYIARVFDGISFVCVSIVALGAFEDLVEEKRGFWTGFFLSLGTIGTLIGPIIAGYIAQYNSDKILLLISGSIAFFSIFLLFFIKEHHFRKRKIHSSDLNPLSEIKKFLKYRELKGMAILGVLMNSTFQIYAIFFPIYVVKNLHLPNYYLGFLLAFPTVFSIFQFYYGRIADNISAEFGILFGVFLVAISFIALPYINSIYELIIVLLINGIGGGIWNVNAWSLMGNIAKKRKMEGEVVGTYMSLAKLGVFFSILFSAYIVDLYGIAGTIQIFALIILFGSIFGYFLFQPVFHHESKQSYFHHVLNEDE